MVTRKHDNREVLWLRADQLIIAAEYQRDLNSTRVRRIAEDFDPEALGVLEVSERPDGRLVLIDGQHRWAALNLMGWGDQLVPVIKHEGLTLDAEARIFRLRNSGVQPKPIDLYKSDLIEGRPDAIAIQAITENLGLFVSTSTSAGSVRAVSALRKVYSSAGSIVLGRALKCIRDAWGLEPRFYNAELIKALGMLITRYGYTGGPLDDRRLVSKLQRQTIDSLIAQSHQRRAFTSFSASTALVLVLVDQYNSNLRTATRLPQWLLVHESYVWKSQEWLEANGHSGGSGRVNAKVKASSKPKKDTADDADAA